MRKRTKILSVVTDTYAYFWSHLKLMRYFSLLLLIPILELVAPGTLYLGILPTVVAILYVSMLVMMIRHIVLEKHPSYMRVVMQFTSIFFWRFVASIFVAASLALMYFMACMWLLSFGIETLAAVASQPELTTLFFAAVLVGLSVSAMVFFLFYIVGYIAIFTTNIAASRTDSFHLANYHIKKEGFYFVGGLAIALLPLVIISIALIGVLVLPLAFNLLDDLLAYDAVIVFLTFWWVYFSLLPTIYVAMFYRCLHMPSIHHKHRLRTAGILRARG